MMKKDKKLTLKTLSQKLATEFGVKSSNSSIDTKVDEEDRTIKAIGNTYFLIDSDYDMLIPGCCKKSIEDRGPESKATAKIKHQQDHILNTKNVVGRMTVLDERKIDGFDVLYFESFIPRSVKGNEHLTNYVDMIYDNHSIGFRYKTLIFASLDSPDELSVEAWNEFYPMALNPEKADEFGGFWVVKEIELFEISVVSFGANQLTANLGGKSKDSNDKLKEEIFERLESLNAQLKSNADSKDDKKTIGLEILQMRQIITDLKLEKPSKEDTIEPSDEDTSSKGGSTSKLNKYF